MIFAIGDIHGRFDLVIRALERLAPMARKAPGSKLVFLGDYIDRGPSSRRVVELMIAGMAARPLGAWICLRGNHEQMMLDALDGDAAADRTWRAYGGLATLASYGGPPPAEHLEWMRSLPTLYETEHHVFVHAGLRPGVAIEDQADEEKLWIRDRFLASSEQFQKHVVHGHTPEWAGKPEASKVELLPHRTNLDTGAYATGVLAVGVFDETRAGGPVDVLEVR